MIDRRYQTREQRTEHGGQKKQKPDSRAEDRKHQRAEDNMKDSKTPEIREQILQDTRQ